jgi:transposase
MTKSYSLDLRRRVARFVEAGHSCQEAARPTLRCRSPSWSG